MNCFPFYHGIAYLYTISILIVIFPHQSNLSSSALSDDLKVQKDELERGVSELRSLLDNASQQYGALERAKEKAAKEAQQDLENKEQEIGDLKNELKKINAALEANLKKGKSL